MLIALIVVSYRDSTSNHNCAAAGSEPDKVVSYRDSTSNHNSVSMRIIAFNVVSYRDSTSNHNKGVNAEEGVQLYLIEILHQTTTRERLFAL